MLEKLCELCCTYESDEDIRVLLEHLQSPIPSVRESCILVSQTFVFSSPEYLVGSLVVEKVRHSIEYCSFGCSGGHRSSITDRLRRFRRAYQEYRCGVRFLEEENQLTSSVRIDCGRRRTYRSKQMTWKISSKISFIAKSQYVNQPPKPYRNSWKQRTPPWFPSFSPISSTSTTRITRCDDSFLDPLIVQLSFSLFLLRSISSDDNCKQSPWTPGSHVRVSRPVYSTWHRWSVGILTICSNSTSLLPWTTGMTTCEAKCWRAATSTIDIHGRVGFEKSPSSFRRYDDLVCFFSI